jgi:acetyl esterase/lipase
VRPSPSSLVGAQARAVVVMGVTLGLPGSSRSRRGRAHLTEESFAGSPATVIRPAGKPPWPALVFINGATPDGRAHPMVLRLGGALARTGCAVFIPDIPRIAGGELSPATVARSVDCVEAVADLPEVAEGRPALAGVSVGASLALLTAGAPRVARRLSSVACVAPYSDLAKVIQLATTGTYRDGARSVAYPVPAYLRVGLARSLAAMLPETGVSQALCSELRALDPSSANGLVPRRHLFEAAGEEAVSLFDLLDNSDPSRFDELYAALPGYIRVAVEELSPLRRAPEFHAPVEIVSAPRDRYFPLAESRALVAASAQVRLTVTSLLAHATPRLDPRYLVELGRLNGFFVRALASAA